jgi:two-component system OmpR family sensor kinase
MVRLVEILLLFSRAESRFQAKDLELLNLCDLVRDELSRAGNRAPEEAARITATLPEEALVLGEEQLLVHAVVNLLDNARKHTPKDVAIEVSVQLSPATVELRVADQGPGITGEHQQRIFEPFFRDPASRARTDGHGLGLPFARSVARAHGGDLWLETERAVGACFVMRLPRQPDAAP